MPSADADASRPGSDGRDMDALERKRLADVEADFRAHNDVYARLMGESRGSDYARPVAFACECSVSECERTVRATLAEYARVRADEKAFVVAPRHVEPAIEDVIEQHERYWVVRKRDDLGLADE